jgi:hypothetical protein
MVSYSMQSGLIYVGVKFYAISDVSNNGGDYGQMMSILNTGFRSRKGGILRSK